ncbi:MAG: hypothetical protein NT154_12385 [Verrucomicrobia bacterium]|nr:hypothetical protein [Verrucomicrobiota bacterium]
MSKNSLGDTLIRLSFCLADGTPGPSVGDAADYIEALGFNLWNLFSLDLARETPIDGEWLAEFEVVGPRALVEELRLAHDRASGSTSADPRTVGPREMESHQS